MTIATMVPWCWVGWRRPAPRYLHAKTSTIHTAILTLRKETIFGCRLCPWLIIGDNDQGKASHSSPPVHTYIDRSDSIVALMFSSQTVSVP